MTSFLLSIKLSIHPLTEFSHTIMRRWGIHQQMKKSKPMLQFILQIYFLTHDMMCKISL